MIDLLPFWMRVRIYERRARRNRDFFILNRGRSQSPGRKLRSTAFPVYAK